MQRLAVMFMLHDHVSNDGRHVRDYVRYAETHKSCGSQHLCLLIYQCAVPPYSGYLHMLSHISILQHHLAAASGMLRSTSGAWQH